MNQLSTARLAELAINALERTAFVVAESVDAERAAELSPPTRIARISYTGPTAGQIFLAASDGFVCDLVCSMLGVEPDQVDPDTEGQDALKELTNIVGGSALQELGGDECAHLLGLPELADPHDVPAVVDPGRQCFLDSDGELLSVAWMPEAHTASTAA